MDRIGAKSAVSGSLSIIALLVVFAVLWRVLATPSMSISEISIPKSLTEIGYTPTEISSQLRNIVPIKRRYPRNNSRRAFAQTRR